MPIAVSTGEPAGIGPDIIIAAWLKRHDSANPLPPFYVIGDIQLLRRRAMEMGTTIDMLECRPENAEPIYANALPVVPEHIFSSPV